jgi:hypothetical protein
MRPRVFLGTNLSYSYKYGPEMGSLYIQLLWLVLGGVPLPPDILQPPGHVIHLDVHSGGQSYSYYVTKLHN